MAQIADAVASDVSGSNPAHAKKKFPTCDKINNLIITLKYNILGKMILSEFGASVKLVSILFI